MKFKAKDSGLVWGMAPRELIREEEKRASVKREERLKKVALSESSRTAEERKGKLSTFKPKQVVTNGKVRARVIEIDHEHGRLRVRTVAGKSESWGPDFVTVVSEK